jgi:hypothetical protein
VFARVGFGLLKAGLVWFRLILLPETLLFD